MTSQSVKVGIELEWDGDGGAVRQLRLPDGTLVALTSQQFADLESSITSASHERCVDLAMGKRRTFNSPEVHGFIPMSAVMFNYRSCWQAPSLPGGPLISYNEQTQAWELAVVELGRHAFRTPVSTAAWNDVEGMKDLCALAQDPAAALTLVALAFPAELAAAVVAADQQDQWETIQSSSQVRASLVKSRALRFLEAGNSLGANVQCRAVGVQRAALRLNGSGENFGVVVVVGVEVLLPSGQRITADLIAWLRQAMAGGRIRLTVVEHQGRVFVVRNAAFLVQALEDDILKHLNGSL